MKRLLALLLAAVMAVSLTACGGASKEDMLAQATEADPDYLQDIVDEAKANEARLVNNYEGQIVTHSGIVVSDISSSGTVTVGLSTVRFYFDLAEDEIEQFEVGDLISFVGKIDDITVSSDTIRISLSPAYLVEALGPSAFK